MIKEDPSLKISLIQERINGMFNYNISYRKAWKAKQKAITIEYGDWDESHAVLPSWLMFKLWLRRGSILMCLKYPILFFRYKSDLLDTWQ